MLSEGGGWGATLDAMISLDEARARLAAVVRLLPPVEVPLAAALGCRLAAAPRAELDLPPADVAEMDGWAARAADLGGSPLPVAFTVPAGEAPPPLPSGQAARIFTGAPLPRGADAVVAQEDAEVDADDRVCLPAASPGCWVRHRGEVVAAGAPLAAIGDLVTAQRLGLMAAAGGSTVRVVPRPRLAVVMNGSELVEAGVSPGPGQIRNANGPMMDALARSAGLVAPPQVIAPDEPEVLQRALAEAAAVADLVVTSGGVSVGDYDLVPGAVAALGGEIVFHRVRVKPGKPVLAARLGAAWLLGLPGNPLAVLAGWCMLGLPLVRALAGDPAAFTDDFFSAELTSAVANDGERTVLRPARLEREVWAARVTVLPWRGSHDLTAGAAADALVRLEPGERRAAGERVRCYVLPAPP